MQTLTAPELLVSDLADFSGELDQLIEAARPYGCNAIELVNETYQTLHYVALVVVGHDFDADGCNPRFEKCRFTVCVTESMPLTTVAFLVIGEVNALIEA